MRIFTFVAWVCTCLFIFSSSTRADDKTWKLVSDKGGVQLFKESNRGVKHKMFKSVAVIDSPIEAIMDVLLDANRFKEWMPGCLLSNILSEKPVDNRIKDYTLHMALDISWPFKNRDFVVNTKTTADWNNGIFFMELNSVEREDIPSPKGSFRMLSLYGKFEGESISKYQTRITYYSVFNTGGRVGSIVSNNFTGRITRGVVAGLVKVAEKPEYKKAAKQNIY